MKQGESMEKISRIRVWNFDLPPYPREGLFHLDMSPDCQVNRFLRFEAGRLACLHQLDVIADETRLRSFQRGLRAKLWRKFGCRYDGSLPLEVREFGTIRKPDFSITKLIYQSRPGIFVTALLYVPSGKGPFPGVIQMHGHNPEGKFAHNPQAMSLALVKSGYVCLMVDAFGTYERADACYTKERHGGFLGASLFNVGETLMGAQVVDNMRGVDLLQSLFQNRIHVFVCIHVSTAFFIQQRKFMLIQLTFKMLQHKKFFHAIYIDYEKLLNNLNINRKT